MLDAMRLLVAAFEELSSEEPDADCVSAGVQQALLFLGNTNAHFSQILKKLSLDVQSLVKDADFSQATPYLFSEGVSYNACTSLGSGKSHSSPVGCLKWAKANWEKITQDPWALSTISGYEIEFWSNPIQTHPPASLNLPQKQI